MMWTEDAPTHCPNGHELGPDRVLVGWDAGRAGSLDHGHRIHICRTCDTVAIVDTHLQVGVDDRDGGQCDALLASRANMGELIDVSGHDQHR